VSGVPAHDVPKLLVPGNSAQAARRRSGACRLPRCGIRPEDRYNR